MTMNMSERHGRPRRCGREQRSTPRPRTMSLAALQRWHSETHDLAVPAQSHSRPTTRDECRQGPRPCPFVGCRHHLYLEVKPNGALTVTWPHLEPWEIPESCSLDVAERDSHTLDEIGELLNLSWERIRRIETQSLAHLREEHGDMLSRFLGPGCHACPSEGSDAPPESATETSSLLADIGGS